MGKLNEQYCGAVSKSYGEWEDFSNNAEFAPVRKKPVVVHACVTATHLDIPTIEGIMHADAGDVIIQGVTGRDFYPVKPDIYDKLYDEDRGTLPKF